MSLADVTFYETTPAGYPGDIYEHVASGANASINAGEPVSKALGQEFATALGNAKPVVGTDYMCGIAATTSTDTVAKAGSVRVARLLQGIKYLCAANNAALIATQAEYDALVGARVTFNLTNGVYTINLTDGSTNGLVVEPMIVSENPGKVCFSIRNGVNFLS